MAWLTKGSKRYYYRKRKVGGKVISQYVAGGRIGKLVAQQDAAERQQRKADREAERRRLAEVDAIDAQIDNLGEQLRDMVTAALVVSGYRTHKRQWRKQRGTGHSSG